MFLVIGLAAKKVMPKRASRSNVIGIGFLPELRFNTQFLSVALRPGKLHYLKWLLGKKWFWHKPFDFLSKLILQSWFRFTGQLLGELDYPKWADCLTRSWDSCIRANSVSILIAVLSMQCLRTTLRAHRNVGSQRRSRSFKSSGIHTRCRLLPIISLSVSNHTFLQRR